MPAPLDGLTILDMTIWQNGPWATVMLSDMGASVIKIEDPVKGDPGRNSGAFPRGPSNTNNYFQTMNRNKRGMTLDLKTEAGRQVFYRMAKKADVITQNFRVGVVEKLGVDYETVRRHNPRIIYASSSGLGARGPHAREGVMDILGQARSGFMWLNAGSEDEPVYRIKAGIADQTGAMVLAHGVMLGIIARERYGVGQHIETSQLGSSIMLQALAFNGYLLSGSQPTNQERKEVSNPLWNIYKCQDGAWLAMGCTQSDRFWRDFVEVLEIEQLEQDPRFKDHASRTANSQELIGILDRVFITRPREAWVDELRAREVYCQPVQDYRDLSEDPQAIANGYIVDVPHPTLGTLKQTGIPIAMTETPGGPRGSAPEFGQHTEEVLQEHGYGWDEITELRDQGVI